MEFGIVLLAILIFAAVVAAGFFAGRLISQDDPKKKLWGWVLVFVVAIFAIALPGMVLFKVYSIFDLYKKFLTALTDAGVDRQLATGILLIAFLPYAVLIKWFFSFKSERRKIARASVIVYIAAFNFVMYAINKDKPFLHPEGGSDTVQSRQWYAKTPEGCVFYDSPGYDTKYGIKLLPVTPEAQIDCMSLKDQITGINFSDSNVYFDPATGIPVKWYAFDGGGVINIFTHAGYDQTTGRQLQPVNFEIIQRHQRQQDSIANFDKSKRAETVRKEQEQQRAAGATRFKHGLISGTGMFQGAKDLAIVPTKATLDAFGIDFSGLRDGLVAYAQRKQLRVVGSPFTEQFITDGYADHLMANDTKILGQLQLDELKGQLLIVDLRQSESGVPSAGGLKVVELTAHLCRIGLNGVVQADRSIIAKGVQKNSQYALQQALSELKAKINELD